MVGGDNKHGIRMRFDELKCDGNTRIKFKKLVKDTASIITVPSMIDPTTFDLKNEAIFHAFELIKCRPEHINEIWYIFVCAVILTVDRIRNMTLRKKS